LIKISFIERYLKNNETTGNIQETSRKITNFLAKWVMIYPKNIESDEFEASFKIFF